MKPFIFNAVILLTVAGFAQSLQEMHPVLGALIDKSFKGEEEFNKNYKICEALWNKQFSDNKELVLSQAELKFLEKCDETKEDYWSILGAGCSWYCGGGQDVVTASSELKSFNDIHYSAKNIHDLNYKTPWIEGVPGYGIGEFVTYNFPPQSPRITEIIVVNGYVKTAETWKNNSRVKQLKMYVNDKPFALLNLKDSKREQHFKVEPLGHADRKDWDALLLKPWWTIKFEIVSVYKGDKYDDTVLTEIYFDGIDVH